MIAHAAPKLSPHDSMNAGDGSGSDADADSRALEREAMVRDQIQGRGVKDEHVLRAVRKVRRHMFVPESLSDEAYRDRPVSIGLGQTISQPYIVAGMTELLRLKGGERVLEIGTGSGYQAAVLAEIAGQVHSVEILEALYDRVRDLPARLGYSNLFIHLGDGYDGLPEFAPYDAIILTAAPVEIPPPLFLRLRPGGRLVAPVGGVNQELVVYTKTETGLKKETVFGVRFVPMTGKAAEGEE